MSEPKRYNLIDIISCGEPWREMEEDESDGDWIKFDDYATIRAENAALKAKLATMVCEKCLGSGRDVRGHGTQRADYGPCPTCKPKGGDEK